jgi:hypothetical protein
MATSAGVSAGPGHAGAGPGGLGDPRSTSGVAKGGSAARADDRSRSRRRGGARPSVRVVRTRAVCTHRFNVEYATPSCPAAALTVRSAIRLPLIETAPNRITASRLPAQPAPARHRAVVARDAGRHIEPGNTAPTHARCARADRVGDAQNPSLTPVERGPVAPERHGRIWADR